jgi:hypothetical protein
MGTAAIGIAEKEDEEQGIDQQDIFYGVVSFLAAITPTGKPPPLAVRLAEALPFRRADNCSREPPFNEPPRSLGRRFSCETGKANLTSVGIASITLFSSQSTDVV